MIVPTHVYIITPIDWHFWVSLGVVVWFRAITPSPKQHRENRDEERAFKHGEEEVIQWLKR